MKTKIYISLEEDSEQLVVNGPLHLLHQLVYAFRDNLAPPFSRTDAHQQEHPQLTPKKESA